MYLEGIHQIQDGISDVIDLSQHDVSLLRQIHQELSIGLENLRIVPEDEVTHGRKYQIHIGSDVIDLTEHDLSKLKQTHRILSMALKNLGIVEDEETFGRKYQIREEDLQKKYAQGRLWWLIPGFSPLLAGLAGIKFICFFTPSAHGC